MSGVGVQLALGLGLIALSTAILVLFIGLAMMARAHVRRLLPGRRIASMMALIAAVSMWLVIGQITGVFLSSVVFIWIGAFDALEPALYFTLSAYTTLGFGDVLPPEKWRILGALIGAQGMLGFGVATAALVEFVTRLRREL